MHPPFLNSAGEFIGFFVGSGAVLVSLPPLIRARHAVRHTTLTTAWRWAAATVALWSIAWLLTGLVPLDPGLADQLWYGVVLLLVATPIAVLGAKRPGIRVWGWFILLPLLLVLGWPAGYAWQDGWPPRRLLLMEPAVLAILVVTMMGWGNYLGTRYHLAAWAIAATICLFLAPYVGFVAGIATDTTCRTLGTLLLAGGIRSAVRAHRHQVRPEHPYSLLWDDFRHQFGIVWARRLQERFNDAALKGGWPARIGPNGLYWTDAADSPRDSQNPRVHAEVEQTLRWLLRRFVDPPWIDDRLQQSRDDRNVVPPRPVL